MTALVFATRLVRLRQVAAWATQCEVAHDGVATQCSRHDVFDVESDPGSQLDQPAVLARTTSAGYHELADTPQAAPCVSVLRVPA